MSDTLQEWEDQMATTVETGECGNVDCACHEMAKKLPATSDISDLLDQLRAQLLEVVEERNELRKVVQELLNRFYPHQCDRGPTCYKCRALRRGTGMLNDQKERSE